MTGIKPLLWCQAFYSGFYGHSLSEFPQHIHEVDAVIPHFIGV